MAHLHLMTDRQPAIEDAKPDAVSGLLEALRDLAPLLHEQRGRFDTLRRLPDEVFEALADAGLFRLWLPKAIGGPELSLFDFMRVVEAASAIDGSVGWLIANGGGMSRAGGYVGRAVARDWFADRRGFVAAATGAIGTATPVAGGYRVSGRWPFGSGAHHASLGAHGSVRPLVLLDERRGAAPAPRRGRLGLYHFAILLPDRASLGRFVRHLAASGERAGAADHLVSEALYLQDPDNLGIEVYADRPRDTWRRQGGQVIMATDPIDVAGLLAAAGETAWSGMPLGTEMGHVHLHVGDIDRAAAFYADGLGFDRTAWNYPGALFMSAGGYHHHLGTNTWAGAGARAPGEGDARLAEWTLEVPNAEAVAGAWDSLAAAGHAAERDGGDVVARDPWGTTVRVRTRGESP